MLINMELCHGFWLAERLFEISMFKLKLTNMKLYHGISAIRNSWHNSIWVNINFNLDISQ